MLGDRDSELCCVAEHQDFLDLHDETSQKTYQVSQFAFEMRMRLLRLYLGLSSEDEKKFIFLWREDIYKAFRDISNENTNIYNQIFKTPNTTETRVELENLRPHSSFITGIDHTAALGALSVLKGYIVDFPFNFLKKEHYKLSPSIINPEFLVPTDVFL